MDGYTRPISSGSSQRKPVRRAGTTRERLGCLTCRHRRKKCDELYPICGHCRRLNLVCKREEPRIVIPDSATVQEPETSTVVAQRLPPSKLPKVVDIWSLDPEKSQDRRAMLGYYTSVLAVLLTTNHDNNSFLSVFLPMAIESKPLQISLVAWSSTHLSRISRTHEITALENRSSALVHVASSLCVAPVTPSDFDTMLASCLILCATEIALGDTENWYRHLQGAKQIIMAAKGRGRGGKDLRGPECYMRSSDGQWLLRNFAYHDVLGSVTSTEGPLLKGAYWIDEEATETVVDAYIGIGSGVLAILSEISDLDTNSMYESKIIESEEDDEDDGDGDVEMEVDLDSGFWPASDELESKLEQWTCPECPDTNLVDLAEAYRHCAFIILYRKQRSFLTSFPQDSPGRTLALLKSKITDSVSSTITHIQAVPVRSLPECGLLFPLFLVGGETLEPKSIELVRARMQALLNDRGFGNIAKAQEVLEELWRLRISGVRGPDGRQLDWMDILKRKGWRLMLS